METYYKAYKISLKNGKAPTTVDLEEEDGDKATLPVGQRATKPRQAIPNVMPLL
jgi:hypothetical protein